MGRNFLDNPLLLILLVLIIVLVFGANRLPGAARSLGRSMRIFKSEVKEMRDDDRSSAAGTGAPLEGRVVDPGQPTDARTDAQRSEAQHADSQRAEAQRAAEQRTHDTQRDA